MSTNVIADVLSAGESEHVEFKAGARDLQSIGATVCAFLNTHGGTIIVGVDSHGKVRPMDDAAKVARAVEQGERIPASRNSLTVGRPLGGILHPGQRAGVCRQCSVCWSAA